MANYQPGVLKTDEFQNWTTLAVGINVSCYGISEFLTAEIQKLYTSLKYGPCASLSLCTQNCSQTAVSLSAWCNSCKVWKAELVKLVKSKTHEKKIKWGRICSAKWSTNVEEVVKVFAPHWWDNTTPYWEDLSVGLSIILNCSLFTLPKKICLDARTVRNKNAHARPEVTKKNFKILLSALFDLLNLKEIQGTKAGNIALRQLEWLKKNKRNVNIQKEKEIDISNVLTLFAELKEFKDDIKYIKHQIEKAKIRMYQPKNLENGFCKTKHVFTFIIFTALCAFSIKAYLTFNEPYATSTSGCLSIKTSFPWQLEINFQTFLEDHSTVVGRKWLVEDITERLHQHKRGIFLTAEMGYGKSAIVSHILCSPPESPAYKIKQKVLYYHICKFDILTSQRVDIFIRQLASNLMKKHPTIGNAIQMDDMAMKFLESKLCVEDPSGCFEFAFIRPLKNFEDFEVQYVVIDALDECDENEQMKFSLSKILSGKIKSLPKWMKFLITSRVQYNLQRRFNFLNLYSLNTTDERNRKDVINFLRSEFRKRFTSLQKSVGGIDLSSRTITQYLQLSKGNFLFLVHALQFWLSSPNCSSDDIPDTLNELFERNLDRIFDNPYESFPMARDVFEVLCTTSKPLSENNITEILNIKDTGTKSEIKSLLANKLSHFVRQNRGMYTVIHKAICDYLVDPRNMKYFVSQGNGHKRFAKYLFSFRSQNKFNEDEIFDLVVHVSESTDMDLLFEFQKYYNGLLTNDSISKHLIHTFCRKRNSYRGTKLLLSISSDAVNSLNDENVTSAFLAAAFGNAETLKAIIEEGGDVNFKIKPIPQRLGLIDAVLFCKHTAHWGYSLLDIAAQNGHLKVVEAILESAEDLVIHRNGIGITAVHLAAEQGHTQVVQTLLRINETLGDQHALYLASKNGHPEVVSLLIELGVRDTCLRCDGTAYWLKENVRRAQWMPSFEETDVKNVSIFLESQVENITVTLIDDEMFVTCSSALEVAVRHGHYDVTKLLLSKISNALHCREYGGRTPILTAVKYNRSQIFDYLIDKGGNISDRCLHKIHFGDIRIYLNADEYKQYLEEKCHNGSRVPHLIAMYDREDIFLNLYVNHTKSPTFWNVRDSDNATPLHIAACHKNKMLLHYFYIICPSFLNDRTTNGSSAIHSAVVCRSRSQLYLLKDIDVNGVSATDNDGRNILHYLSKEPYSKHYSVNETEIIYDLLFNVTDSTKKHFYGQDIKGNNFLHFAAANGKYNVLEICRELLKSDIVTLLLMKNEDGQNVFDIAVDKLPTTGNTINLPSNCRFTQVLGCTCNAIPDIILSHEEQFLIYLVQMKYTFGIEAINITSILRKVLEQGNAATTLFVWEFMKTKPNLQDFVNSLSWSEPNYQITLFFLQHCDFSCKQPFEKSFFHRVLMNEDNLYWFITTELHELKNAICKKTAQEWDRCYDAEGYNILHRAIIGGNLGIVKFLLNYGMSLTTISQKNIDIRLQVVILAPSGIPLELPYTNPQILEFNLWNNTQNVRIEYKIKSPKNTSQFSDIAVFLLNHFGKKNLAMRSVCNENSKLLSLIHITAAKGMTNVTKKLVNLYGERILNCTNVDGFTPMYFAEMYEQWNMIRYLYFKRAIFKQPVSTAETVFHAVVCSNRLDFRKHPQPFLTYMTQIAHPYYTTLRSWTFNRFLYYRKMRKIITLLDNIMKISFNELNLKDRYGPAFLHIYNNVFDQYSLGLLDYYYHAFVLKYFVKAVYKSFGLVNSLLVYKNHGGPFCTSTVRKQMSASFRVMQIDKLIQFYYNMRETASIFKPLLTLKTADVLDFDVTKELNKFKIKETLSKLNELTGYKLDKTDFPLKKSKQKVH